MSEWPRIECVKKRGPTRLQERYGPLVLDFSFNEYRCRVNGSEAQGMVYWGKSRPDTCYIKMVLVEPKEMRRHGVGTHIMADTFLDMYQGGCRRFKGTPIEKEFWGKLRQAFESEDEYDLEVP